jgi:hypothetical protein
MKNYTLERMRRLRIGERMIAYVGNFETDLGRCDSISPSDRGSPIYKIGLEAVCDELRRGEQCGEYKVTKTMQRRQAHNKKGALVDWSEYSYQVERVFPAQL